MFDRRKSNKNVCFLLFFYLGGGGGIYFYVYFRIIRTAYNLKENLKSLRLLILQDSTVYRQPVTACCMCHTIRLGNNAILLCACQNVCDALHYLLDNIFFKNWLKIV